MSKSTVQRNTCARPQDTSSLPELIDDFAEFTAKGSTVTFLLPDKPRGAPSNKGACSFKVSSLFTASSMPHSLSRSRLLS